MTNKTEFERQITFRKKIYDLIEQSLKEEDVSWIADSEIVDGGLSLNIKFSDLSFKVVSELRLSSYSISFYTYERKLNLLNENVPLLSEILELHIIIKEGNFKFAQDTESPRIDWLKAGELYKQRLIQYLEDKGRI